MEPGASQDRVGSKIHVPRRTMDTSQSSPCELLSCERGHEFDLPLWASFVGLVGEGFRKNTF